MKAWIIFILCLGQLGYGIASDRDENAEKAFTHIYETGYWGFHQGEGYSGSGSTVTNATPYMKFLENYLRANQIKSVVDLGCGDWTFSQYVNWGSVCYTGIDIVKSVIEKNQQRFKSPTVNFIHADGVFSNMPEADLLICKDVLQHMSNDRIMQLLPLFKKFKYCLITNDVDPNSLSSENKDIAEGDHRFLDLTKAPFNVEGVKVFLYPSGYVTKQVLLIINRKDL